MAAETGWRAPLGRTFVDRVGDDLTIVTYGALHHRVMAGAEVLAAEHGVEATVLDLATLSPLDIGPIIASVARTGRLLVVHEAHRFADIGAEIVARLHERGLHGFCARRLTGWDVPHPFPGRERHFLDGCQQLVAVGAALATQTPG